MGGRGRRGWRGGRRRRGGEWGRVFVVGWFVLGVCGGGGGGEWILEVLGRELRWRTRWGAL